MAETARRNVVYALPAWLDDGITAIICIRTQGRHTNLGQVVILLITIFIQAVATHQWLVLQFCNLIVLVVEHTL